MADDNVDTICPLTKEALSPLGDFKLPLNTGGAFAEFKPQDGGPAGVVTYSESNIVCDYDKGTLTSTILGMVSFASDGVRVEPLWTVSEDAQTLTMDIYHEDCFNDRLPLAMFTGSLPEGCKGVDKDALGEAAAQALMDNQPIMGVVAAKGQRPIEGKDGRIQLKFSEEAETGTKKEDGTVDFRERGGGSVCVQAGEEVGILHPPTKGRPGFDVLGNEFPATDGNPEVLKAGQGVSSAHSPAGQIIFTSTIEGMVVVKDGVLSVSDVMEVPSDVDMSTGNVRVEKGSILVKGTVTTGAEVEAAESVYVEVVVENATIKAGADVTVAGGILMEEGGIIEAGGNVTAKFIRNGTIRAGGDVIVDVDMVNCDIVAGGRIIAGSDKGALNGGTYVCGGADVAEIGTSGGTKTSVSIELPDSGLKDVQLKEDEIRKRIEELGKFIGTDSLKNTLLMAPKEDRAILAELYRIKTKLIKGLTVLADKRGKLLKEQAEALAKLHLKARRTAHAGSTINIGNKSITLNKAEQASKFHWDAEQSGIATTGL